MPAEVVESADLFGSISNTALSHLSHLGHGGLPVNRTSFPFPLASKTTTKMSLTSTPFPQTARIQCNGVIRDLCVLCTITTSVAPTEHWDKTSDAGTKCRSPSHKSVYPRMAPRSDFTGLISNLVIEGIGQPWAPVNGRALRSPRETKKDITASFLSRRCVTGTPGIGLKAIPVTTTTTSLAKAAHEHHANRRASSDFMVSPTLPTCHEVGGRDSCACTRRERQPNWQRWLGSIPFHLIARRTL